MNILLSLAYIQTNPDEAPTMIFYRFEGCTTVLGIDIVTTLWPFDIYIGFSIDLFKDPTSSDVKYRNFRRKHFGAFW